MEKVDAMNYEYLIRRAFQCGRFGVAGANADIFRSLERSYGLYTREKELKAAAKPKEWNKSIEELALEYGRKSGEVAAFLDSAISKVLHDYENRLSPEQKEELNQCLSDLFEPSFDDILHVIERSEKVMLELGIYPR